MSDATPGDAKERSAEQNKSEAELIGRIIQSEQKLSDYFTTMIVKSVTDQLERRNVARLRLIGLVVASLLAVAVPFLESLTERVAKFRAVQSDPARREHANSDFR